MRLVKVASERHDRPATDQVDPPNFYILRSRGSSVATRFTSSLETQTIRVARP